MLIVKNEYAEGDFKTTEYTKDGINVCHVVKSVISSDVQPSENPMPTTEEMQMQTLLNTEYLVVISEISTM